MISKTLITELRDKWQTTELNIAKEFVQHVLLSALFQIKGADVNMAFKGGTALRFIYNSPRFSEDLDFTARAKPFHVKKWLSETTKEAGRTGLDFKIIESTQTSGGWLAVMQTHVHNWPVQIEWNISLRKSEGKTQPETMLVTTPLWLPYSLTALSPDQIVQEKIEALIRRKKPRDFFDLYYMIRERIAMKPIISRKKELLREVKTLNDKSTEIGLKQFLPRRFGPLIRHLPKILIQELERI